MVSVEEAQKIIFDNLLHLPIERIPLDESTGRILAENVIADRDFPPYDRVAMDGIAIDFKAFSEGKRTFQIAATGAAGAPQIVLSDHTSCVEIMTGAILPVGTDTVIRYEDIEVEDGKATIQIEKISQGQNVHRKGIDRKADDQIIASGRYITPAEIGVLATVGMHEVSVLSQPTVCVISTGDEVISVNQRPLPHQIRASNTHTIAAILRNAGIATSLSHLPDDEHKIMTMLDEIMSTHAVIVLSGGVSKGKFDYIPDCLGRLGVVKHFHRITQRPGKPFWFGSKDRRNFVFALPGNPVSTTLCTLRYLLPWIDKSRNVDVPAEYVRLEEDVHFRPDLTLFQQCLRTPQKDGSATALPVIGHGSGDLASLTSANGFIELPKGRDLYRQGEVYRWWKWQN